MSGSRWQQNLVRRRVWFNEREGFFILAFAICFQLVTTNFAYFLVTLFATF